MLKSFIGFLEKRNKKHSIYGALILGYYLLFSASYLNPGTKAVVVSTKYALTATECKLVFYYHMAGIDMGRLSVELRHQFDNTYREASYLTFFNVSLVSSGSFNTV